MPPRTASKQSLALVVSLLVGAWIGYLYAQRTLRPLASEPAAPSLVTSGSRSILTATPQAQQSGAAAPRVAHQVAHDIENSAFRAWIENKARKDGEFHVASMDEHYSKLFRELGFDADQTATLKLRIQKTVEARSLAATALTNLLNSRRALEKEIAVAGPDALNSYRAYEQQAPARHDMRGLVNIAQQSGIQLLDGDREIIRQAITMSEAYTPGAVGSVSAIFNTLPTPAAGADAAEAAAADLIKLRANYEMMMAALRDKIGESSQRVVERYYAKELALLEELILHAKNPLASAIAEQEDQLARLLRDPRSDPAQIRLTEERLAKLRAQAGPK